MCLRIQTQHANGSLDPVPLCDLDQVLLNEIMA